MLCWRANEQVRDSITSDMQRSSLRPRARPGGHVPRPEPTRADVYREEPPRAASRAWTSAGAAPRVRRVVPHVGGPRPTARVSRAPCAGFPGSGGVPRHETSRRPARAPRPAPPPASRPGAPPRVPAPRRGRRRAGRAAPRPAPVGLPRAVPPGRPRPQASPVSSKEGPSVAGASARTQALDEAFAWMSMTPARGTAPKATLDRCFAGALPGTAVLRRSAELLKPFGLTPENTIYGQVRARAGPPARTRAPRPLARPGPPTRRPPPHPPPARSPSARTRSTTRRGTWRAS